MTDTTPPRILENFYAACFVANRNIVARQRAYEIAKKYRGLGNKRPGNLIDAPTTFTIAIGFNVPLEILRALIDNGADPRLTDSIGSSLHCAVSTDNLDAAKLILSKYPECAKFKDKNGMAPLIIAQLRKNVMMIKELEKY